MANNSAVTSDSSESGFTLIELLVSLTIMAVILGIVGSALRTLSKNWETNANRIERLEMISRSFDIFQRDVSGLRRLVHSNDSGRFFIFSGSATRLAFVTTEPAYPTNPGLYFVNYRIENNGAEADLLRERAAYANALIKFPGATPANSVPIMEGAFKYKFSYASRAGSGVKWTPQWTKGNRLPDLIRLEILSTQSGVDIIQPFIAAVRTDAELKCLSEGSDECSARSNGQLGAGDNALSAADQSMR